MEFLYLLTGLFLFLLLFAAWLGWFSPKKPLPPMERFFLGGDEKPSGENGPQLTWLGHSSFRVEWGGQVLLLDPVLSPHVSVAPRQVELPDGGCLQGVDAVLLSHGHMDHFNSETLAKLDPCSLHLPARSERFLQGAARGRHRVHRFRMGDSFSIGHLRVDVVPARHGGWRYPWQLGYFACGFVISGPGSVLYFAGDTAWGGHFAEIGQRFRPDTAILPIGGYSPRFFLKSRHLDPPAAVEAAEALGVQQVIPCHYGAYRVSLESMNAPIRRFRQAMLNRQTGSYPTSGPST